jgi:hypothetical protein
VAIPAAVRQRFTTVATAPIRRLPITTGRRAATIQRPTEITLRRAAIAHLRTEATRRRRTRPRVAAAITPHRVPPVVDSAAVDRIAVVAEAADITVVAEAVPTVAAVAALMVVAVITNTHNY